MVFEVERFVEEIKSANDEGQRAVNEVLQRAVSEPGSMIAGLGEPEKVGMDILHRSPELTILNVVWAPNMVLLPHNHKMWASIGIYTGREDNILWKREGSLVKAAGAASLLEKEVFPLGADAVHSVINPIPRHTGAVHIYGGDFFGVPRSEWDPESLEERPFDFEALKARFSSD